MEHSAYHLLGTQIDGYTLEKLLTHSEHNLTFSGRVVSNLRRVVVKLAYKPCTDLERHTPACYGLAAEYAVGRLLYRHSLQVPQPLALGHVSGQAYMAQESIAGNTLHTLVIRRALSASTLLRIIDQVAETLAAAHGLSLVHHDVKPKNIIVTPRDRAYLIDWGGGARIRPLNQRSPYVVYTPAYAAPEQLAGQVLAANDIYALGRTLEECWPSQIAAIRPIVHRATARLGRRYAGMDELRLALWMLREPDPSVWGCGRQGLAIGT